MHGWGEWETLYFYIGLIRGGGVTALVNTGPPHDLADLNAAWRQFAGPRCQMLRGPTETVDALLLRAGVRAEEVTHLLLTPLQLYATANIAMFPKAEICISRRGWIEDIVERLPWLHVPRDMCISRQTLAYLQGEARSRFRLLDAEERVCPGIEAAWIGTHHRSSVLYMVTTSRGKVGLSDCAFKYGNLIGHPLGIGESLAEGYAAYTRIQREVDHFIPLYDPDVLERYPDGIIA